VIERDKELINKDYHSKKIFASGYYLILALEKKARDRVTKKLFEHSDFNRYNFLLNKQ